MLLFADILQSQRIKLEKTQIIIISVDLEEITFELVSDEFCS